MESFYLLTVITIATPSRLHICINAHVYTSCERDRDRNWAKWKEENWNVDQINANHSLKGLQLQNFILTHTLAHTENGRECECECDCKSGIRYLNATTVSTSEFIGAASLICIEERRNNNFQMNSISYTRAHRIFCTNTRRNKKNKNE